jgi:hypothetical protein
MPPDRPPGRNSRSGPACQDRSAKTTAAAKGRKPLNFTITPGGVNGAVCPRCQQPFAWTDGDAGLAILAFCTFLAKHNGRVIP